MFATFFLGGFEGTTFHDAHGRLVDQVAATHHDRFAHEDYARLREVGIGAAREAVRWPLVDRAGRYDFACVAPFVEAARTHDVEVVWDLFHFGYPRDLEIESELFVERFAEYCFAVAKHLTQELSTPLWFTPVNEPSYFAWAAGEAALFRPHRRGCGDALKRQLARAAIAGTDALRSACPGARLLTVDPICRVTAPAGRPDLEPLVRDFNERIVFQSLDLLSGRTEPELGGSPAHVGTIGINYYWTNQWELGGPRTPLADTDPRRAPLRAIIRDVWERYGLDVAISETAHVGEARGPWLDELACEAEALLDDGVPLGGVCLYPILGMPEWHERDRWTRMGLWDVAPPALDRALHRPSYDALCRAQRLEERRARRVEPG
jgi:hypothetical protein